METALMSLITEVTEEVKQLFGGEEPEKLKWSPQTHVRPRVTVSSGSAVQKLRESGQSLVMCPVGAVSAGTQILYKTTVVRRDFSKKSKTFDLLWSWTLCNDQKNEIVNTAWNECPLWWGSSDGSGVRSGLWYPGHLPLEVFGILWHT